VLWSKDDRLGLYFVEYGASPRASSVLYDRAMSAISRIQPGEVDWASAFGGCRLFHVSGITPALSDSAAAVTAEAIRAAKAAGALVSYDLNYRAKLWSQAKAREIQTPFMADVDVLITTEEDIDRVFGITGADYREVARALADRFPVKVIAITLRGTPSVWRNTWSCLVYADGRYYDDVTYEVEVVDRVGSGDTFSAGFLFGYLTQGIEYGVKMGDAFAALKHTSWGDFNWATKQEAEALIKGSGLRIVR
jgi:2-dehydro-3-deoxygluconokinase